MKIAGAAQKSRIKTEMIRLLDRGGFQAGFGQPQQPRIRIRHQDWGVRGHDALADLGLIHAAHELQKFDLTRRKQRRFRLVEDKDALTLRKPESS